MSAKRAALGITLDQLETRTGIKKQHLSALERAAPHSLTGKPVVPKRPTVEKIAAGLEASVADALNAAGYATATARPKSVPELIQALQELGLDLPLFHITNAPDPGDEAFEEVVERIWMDINLVLQRHAKGRKITRIELPITDEDKGENTEGDVQVLRTNKG